MTDAFLTAKSLADDLEAQWQQSFARFSCGMITKEAPDPRQHFEIRVRAGAIVILCRTQQANGWHRIRRRNGKPWSGVPVSVVFEPIKLKSGDYHAPEAVEQDEETGGAP